jgi:hypothetical protein
VHSSVHNDIQGKGEVQEAQLWSALVPGKNPGLGRAGVSPRDNGGNLQVP